MNTNDLDPNFLLPLWQALVRYFRAHPPVVHAPQQLELLSPKRATRKPRQKKYRVYPYLSKYLERRLPIQPSP